MSHIWTSVLDPAAFVVLIAASTKRRQIQDKGIKTVIVHVLAGAAGTAGTGTGDPGVERRGVLAESQQLEN